MKKKLLSLLGLTALFGLLSCTAEDTSEDSSAPIVSSEPSSSQVEEKNIESINLIAAKTSLNIGESLKLVVEINPSDATAKSVSFESSNQSVLHVSNDGILTGISEGEATVTCKVISENDQEFAKEVKFTVKEVPVEGVKISNSNQELSLGSETQLIVEFTPENATNKVLTYVSDNSSVISIDQTGLMKALAIGKAKITVRSDSGLFKDTLEFHVVSEYTKKLNEAMNKLKDSESIEAQTGNLLKIKGIHQRKGMTSQYSENTEVQFFSNSVNIAISETQKIGDDSTKKTSKTYRGVDLDHSRYFNFKMSDASKGMSEEDLLDVDFKDVSSSFSLDEMKKDASLYYLDDSDSYGLLNVASYYSGKMLENLKLDESLKKIESTGNGFEITYKGLSKESTPRYVDMSLKIIANANNSIQSIHFVNKIYKKTDLDENNLPKANASTNESYDYLYEMSYEGERKTYEDTSFSPSMFYFTSLGIKTYYQSTDLDNHKYFKVGNTIEIEPINFSPASAMSSVDTISVTNIENENDSGAVLLTEEGILKAAKIGKATITFKTLSGLEVRKEVEVVDDNKVPNGLTEITIDGASKNYLTGNNSLKAGEKHTILFKFQPTSGSQEFSLLCDDTETVLEKVEGGFTISRNNPSTNTIYVTLCGPYDYTVRLRFTFTK